ncbi:MAG: hypothetical protein CM15mP116_03320 [Synechococcus sp.]|nr:MAG: hypothetical protein CM15mP116_03320 [Synechococcus sp.]
MEKFLALLVFFVSQLLRKALVKLLKCITRFVTFDLKGVSK